MSNPLKTQGSMDISPEAVGGIVSLLRFLPHGSAAFVKPKDLIAAADTLDALCAEVATVHGELRKAMDQVQSLCLQLNEARLAATAIERLAKTLAVLAIQTNDYSDNDELRQAVDDVLAATKGVKL